MRVPSTQRGVVVSAIFAAAVVFSSSLPAASNEANIAARVAKLERLLEGRGLVDLLQQLETLQEEVQRLRGQIEEQAYTIEQLRKTQRDTYVDLDQRMQRVERQSGSFAEISPGTAAAPPLTTLNTGEVETVAGTPAPQSSSLQVEPQPQAGGLEGGSDDHVAGVDTGAEASRPASTVVAPALPSIAPTGPMIDNEESEAAYRDAFNLLKAGQYDGSITAFTEFLQQYPESQYADNAQYWLGETHYVKRQFEPAIVEYRKLIDHYPASKKQSHAMLKIGYSFHELGEVDQARAMLEDLRNRYGGTTAARLAEERIQRILAENPAR
ncbi:MAG: tol-pal system protein YbgF [Gammaproteobacteria bacterium]|jgi:tol-pal system protein YbgF|nr:tol-pal system protein YbgF [Gammaproteobacteria bacterium]HJP34772.1 tol-pal system protein YbgF [Gammaproteobacteria bacterium]